MSTIRIDGVGVVRCSTCSREPSFQCREHYIADIAALRTLARELAEALLLIGHHKYDHAEGCAAHDESEHSIEECGDDPNACPLDEECSCSVGAVKRALARAREMGVSDGGDNG